tara:strand:+ start:31 stop:456 length:426 start_codon:yes stop_codon:yes gene_type:complete
MSEWKYVRTNSKGKKIYRRNTNESLEFVIDYLQKQDLPYEVCMSASFIYITNIANIQYLYYWTTGRWCARQPHISLYEKHEHSKGIEDFVTNYLHADTPTQIAHKFEDLHTACFSYPNCDEAPLGCVIRMGKDVEPYGHRD